MPCRHHDIQVFDNVRCCLACGETVFDSTPEHDPTPGYAKPEPYHYARLNYALGQEIRLVVLFPGRPLEDVCLDIIHINLSDKPAYEAVSYAWATQDGDDSLSQTVYCRGRTIAVTKHCEAALRSLRRRGRKRLLWIDAISIDQGNIAERNHQVSFMGSIYADASQVVIYLGPGNEDIDRVLDFLNGNFTAFNNTRRDSLANVVRTFMKQRWLDRVWVLQEIALAKLATMIAGNKTVEWTSLSIEKLLVLCQSLDLNPPSALHWLPASKPEIDILTVLQKSRNCSSTDPRDKVFAVLGLVHREFQNAFPVDYSLTPEEVCTNLAIYLIEQKSLSVLKHVSAQSSIPPATDLPSWAPQWGIKAGYSLLPPQFDSAELEMLSSIWFSSGTESMLEEVVLAEISKNLLQSSTVIPTAMIYDQLVNWFTLETRLAYNIALTDLDALALRLTQMRTRSFRFAICNRNARYESEFSTAEKSAYNKHLPVYNKHFSQNKIWPCLRIRAHHLDAISKMSGPQSVNQAYSLAKFHGTHKRRILCAHCDDHFVHKPLCQTRPSVGEATMDEFNRVLQQHFNGGQGQGSQVKVFFYTANSIGFAQKHLDPVNALTKIRVLDSIWALDGADVPFILRKVDQHYVLIGECYLYRALRPHVCMCCGCEVEPWPIATEIIDIW